jgi:hypothetical protein
MEYREATAPPDRWQDFEDLCLKLWRPRLIDAKKHGRSGQPQAGVDIFGRDPQTEGWVGIQCKQKGQWPPHAHRSGFQRQHIAVAFGAKGSEGLPQAQLRTARRRPR